MAVHCTVTLAGTALITGAVLSVTVIICVLVAEFPHQSVAVQVRVMV